MSGADRLATPAVTLEWEADDGIAVMRFPPGGPTPDETDAKACIGALTAWAKTGDVRLLVDCTGLKDTTPGWRSEFATFFRERPGRIAWFNMTPLIGMMVRMFLLATGFTGRGFRTETESRAWLQGDDA